MNIDDLIQKTSKEIDKKTSQPKPVLGRSNRPVSSAAINRTTTN
jgi:hypothetical protein